MRRAPFSFEVLSTGRAVSTPRYFLSKDCFACRVQGYWVILNAERDKYFCVTHNDLTSMGDHLHGWRVHPTVAEHISHVQTAADGLIESMISSGIITTNQSAGKPFVESECPVGDSALEAPSHRASLKPSFRCITSFFLSCAQADWCLRRKELSHTFARIRRRRLHTVSRDPNPHAANASTLIAAFKRLRPLYPRQYLCLFDSLALAEFLARHCLFPRVVFGVIADPFQAHCWLQEDSTVLNDDLERVLKYKPILAV
jgi:hypothetical protein